MDDLIAATRPLLELFAVCDDVFTEEDAMSEEFRQVTAARIYRAWKECRTYFDPDFHVADHLRPRKWKRDKKAE